MHIRICFPKSELSDHLVQCYLVWSGAVFQALSQELQPCYLRSWKWKSQGINLRFYKCKVCFCHWALASTHSWNIAECCECACKISFLSLLISHSNTKTIVKEKTEINGVDEDGGDKYLGRACRKRIIKSESPKRESELLDEIFI